MRTLLALALMHGSLALQAQFFHTLYGTDNVVHPSFAAAPDAFYLAHGSENELFKTDFDGQVLWSRYLEYNGSPVAIYRMAYINGALLVAGGHAQQQNFLAALDADGDVLWSTAANYGDIHLPTRIHGMDGGYLTVGHRDYPTGGGFTFDLTLCRWDSDGTLLWAKAYGDDIYDYFGWCSLVLPSGEILVAGERKDGSGSKPLIARFDSNGDLSWIEVLADGSSFFTYTQPTDLVATSDGEYALVATTYNTNFNYDPQVIKFDNAGNVQWAQRLYRVGWDERGGSIIEYGQQLLVSGTHALGDQTGGHVVRFGLDGTPLDVIELPGFRSPSSSGYYTGLGQDLMPVTPGVFALAGECAPAMIGPSWHGLATFSLAEAPACFAPEAYPFEYATVSWTPLANTPPTVATDISEVPVALSSVVVSSSTTDLCTILSVHEEAGPAPLVLCPNPSRGQLTISFAEDGAHTVLFSDAQGRVLRSERISGASATLDIRALPVGVYLIREEGSERGARLVCE